MRLIKIWPPVFWGLSLLLALVSLRFLVLGVPLSMPHMMHHLDGRAVALYAHIFCAPVALALMPFQFASGLRARRPGLHRWMGRGYAGMIVIAALAGFVIGLETPAGLVSVYGFCGLAIVWLGTTVYAVWLAMQRRIAEHRVWMIRSAALTFAAVTLRIYVPILGTVHGMDAGYAVTAWLCWVPNLIVAEWFILRKV